MKDQAPISSVERQQPVHRRVTGSSLQILMQGEGGSPGLENAVRAMMGHAYHFLACLPIPNGRSPDHGFFSRADAT